MPTTPSFTRFSSIDSADLTAVSGGCGKKQCRCPAPQAPAPTPSASADLVSTNVSTNYGQQ